MHTHTNTHNLQESGCFAAVMKVKLGMGSGQKCFSLISHHCYMSLRLFFTSYPMLFVLRYFLSVDPYPAGTNSAKLVMREMEEVAVEVVRVFIKQTVKGCGGSIETWSRNGDATERAALPNELEWPIEATAFSQKPRRTKCQNKPGPFSFRGATRRLLTLWSVGI